MSYEIRAGADASLVPGKHEIGRHGAKYLALSEFVRHEKDK
jgi:hypothetical protein